MRKHYFFDMDGTLTESRTRCTPQIEKALKALSRVHDVIVISGADKQQMKKQLPFIFELFRGYIYSHRFFILAQSGTDAVQCGRRLWLRRLNTIHRAVASEHIRIIKSLVEDEIIDPNDLVQDRGGQIAYSLIGHNAPKDKKKAFDPDGSKRLALLEKYPLKSEVVQVRLGGTTCLDYTARGWGKDGNILHLMNICKWKPEDCVYVGDQLYDGGNDAEVKNIFPVGNCYQVESPHGTLVLIKRFLEEV